MTLQRYELLTYVCVRGRPKTPQESFTAMKWTIFIMYVYDFGLFFAASSMLFLTFAAENPHLNAYATVLFFVFAVFFSQLHPTCC